MTTPPAARLGNITKSFGRFPALSGASLEVRSGEIHGLLGENGAGKSTLLSIFGGRLRPDAGSLEIRGTRTEFGTPGDAAAQGIGMVHQHFALVPAFTVLENLALGYRSSRSRWTLPIPDLRDRAARLQAETGLRVPLEASVERLGVGDRQRVEILKALLIDPSILLLDEPTAVLAPSEVDTLFGLLDRLRAQGRAIVLVAHKLDEILGVVDRVTVLRRGRTVLTAGRDEVDGPALVRAMVGEGPVADPAVPDIPRPRGGRVPPGEVVVSLEGAPTSGLNGPLEIRRGEIVGIAGIEGNGQGSLAMALAGRSRPPGTRVRLPAHLGFIPQDRTRSGLAGSMSLVENLALALHRDPAYRTSRPGLPSLLRWSALRERAGELMERYGVSGPGLDAPVAALSGGNQQRVVVAREMALARDVLVAENPTRGLDVASTTFVHQQIQSLSSTGDRPPGVVLISTDLDEIMALAHRIFTIVRGSLREVPRDARSREEIGGLMLSGVEAV
ncbi:MAG: ATP-binding cassette domain-containing protein [Gemmatimonadota bacterium]|nr:ATP-binding cassette domain-containing protein [Gemmatimonadota bacterium]